MCEAKDLAAFALGCEDSQEILVRLQDYVRQVAPSLLDSGNP